MNVFLTLKFFGIKFNTSDPIGYILVVCLSQVQAVVDKNPGWIKLNTSKFVCAVSSLSKLHYRVKAQTGMPRWVTRYYCRLLPCELACYNLSQHVGLEKPGFIFILHVHACI